MESGTHDRGVSEVVGFILLFGMLVTAFTVYQGIIVPDQNRQVEFQHNQEVQGDLQDLRNAIIRTAATGSGEAVSIKLGATYPRRTIAMNLGVSSGTLSTRDVEGGIRLDNVRALEAETRDYINSDTNGPLGPYSTKAIQYTPVYSFYTEAPTTRYENSLAYNRFEGENLTLTDQVIFDGRRITLILINGSLSRAQRGTISVSTEPISITSNRVAVENTSGDRVNVTVPTALPASKWEELLAEEMGTNGYVYEVSQVPGASEVRMTLRQNETYELRIAKVGVGGTTEEASPMYIQEIQGDQSSVPEGGTQKLEVEVRDRYNNPVSGAQVAHGSLSPASVGSLSPVEITTRSDGRATFIYTAPDDVNSNRDIEIPIFIDDGVPSQEIVEFQLSVLDTDGDGGGGEDGAAESFVESNNDGSTFWGSSGVSFSISNTGSSPVTITDIEVESNGPAQQLREQSGGQGQGLNEIYISASEAGWYEAGDPGTYTLGSRVQLSEDATIAADDDGTFYLYRFERNNDDAEDMNGRTVTVDLTFSDGSSTQFDISP